MWRRKDGLHFKYNVELGNETCLLFIFTILLTFSIYMHLNKNEWTPRPKSNVKINISVKIPYFIVATMSDVCFKIV